MSDGVIGRWGVCSRGRIGRIEGQKELPWGLSWVGTGIDGTPWASWHPVLIGGGRRYPADLQRPPKQRAWPVRSLGRALLLDNWMHEHGFKSPYQPKDVVHDTRGDGCTGCIPGRAGSCQGKAA